MKRIFSLLLVLLMLPCLMLPVFASEYTYVADYGDLLSDSEEAALEEAAWTIKGLYGIDAVILTLSGLEGGTTPQDFADDYYDQNNYSEDGVLFLLSMEERDWYISTCGEMIYALTDYGIQRIGEDAIFYMSSGEYFKGFQIFLEELPYYLDAYASGSPIGGQADYSGDYYHGDREEIVYYEEEFTPSLMVSILVGAVVAVISIIVMRASMNTRRKQHSAAVYLKEGSYHLRTHRDLFLYSNVNKTRKQQNNNSSGGSSVHRSSGGRRHGGGGGKF